MSPQMPVNPIAALTPNRQPRGDVSTRTEKREGADRNMKMNTRIARSLFLCLFGGLTLLGLAPSALAQPACTSVAPVSPSTSATTGTFRVHAYGATGNARVLFPTWGDPGGQDDLVWYEGTNQGGGTWYVDIPLANHKAGNPEYGNFNTHAYQSSDGVNFWGCGGTTWTRVQAPLSCGAPRPQASVVYGASGTARMFVDNVASATSVYFPTWGDIGGQDDLVWYPGINMGNGTWYADVNLAQHKAGAPEYGTYHTHVYAYAGSSQVFCGGFTFVRDRTLAYGPARGIWDPGLANGYWRTEYNSTATGTNAEPLTLGNCTWTDAIGAGPTWDTNRWPDNLCRSNVPPGDPFLQDNIGGMPFWSQSNATGKGGVFGHANYWVITVNNERAYANKRNSDWSVCNSGPPNQSFPVSSGAGVANVTHGGSMVTLKVDSRNAGQACQRAFTEGTTHDSITFVSYGLDWQRGNGGVITYLNSLTSPQRLKFQAWSAKESTPSNMHLFIEATHAGIRKWLWLYLDDSLDLSGAPNNTVRVHWNWNIQQSMWRGGAEIQAFNASDLVTCPVQVGSIQRVLTYPSTYDIDLTKLFRCASDRGGWGIPTDEAVPITGIHFAVEQPILIGVGQYKPFPYSTSLSVYDLRLTQ